MHNWLKRIREGVGFIGFSARSWGRVCNVMETIQGVGCVINKTQSGNGWSIQVDGVHSDLPLPEGMTPGGSGIPDETEIWGRVAYDTTNNKFVQYKLIWSAATRTFTESATATDIIALDSHSSQHL
ncbi:hypothetical protein M0R72_21415 [Candidatus Pacearchaeota archaeon]|nr:hypothetical protein [Candidatus Pacearchaeota archaeon]